MRIVYAHPYPVPSRKPEAMQALQTADALARAGAAVELVTPDPGSVSAADVLGREPDPGLQFRRLADLRHRHLGPLRSGRLFAWNVLRHLRRNRPDALYLRNLKLAAYLLPRLPGQPLLFETHELFAQSFAESPKARAAFAALRLRRLERLERAVYRGCGALFALTRTLLEDIDRRYAPLAPVYVLPDGVDLLAAAAAVPTPRPSSPVLLYLGSLHRWKGVEVALRAMPELSGAQLWIAGGEGERIAELAKLAAELGCAERVRFLGFVEPARRFELIAQADVCLLPLTRSSIGSRYTSPLKLFEYLAMGKVVIASDLPALREVLRPDRDALLVAPEDAGALAQASARVLSDPGLRARLEANARELAQRYSWDQRAQTILSAFSRLHG
jgi:glycosyltransferase involved in cell wall biosynthesis